MKTVVKRAAFTALALSIPTPSQAQVFREPAARHFQAARDYPHPRIVKLVLDLNSPTPAPSAVNPGLTAIANLIRRYEVLGRDSPHLQIVVVLHAAATDLALDSAAFAKRNGGVPNGSIPLMRDLAARGVMFVASRESLLARQIAESEVQNLVHFGPTASIIFLDLEASGYVFDGTRGLGAD